MRIYFVSVIAFTLLAGFAQAQTSGSEQKGASGWSGGAKDPVSQSGGPDKAAQNERDAEAARTMPEMASGIDLKGPARQFAPRNTPE